MPDYVDYAYCSARIGNLGDLVPDGADAEDWVEAWIDDAEAQVNAKLMERYGASIPFTSPSNLVKRIVFELAHYLMLRQNITGEDSAESDWPESIRKSAEKLLDQLADGTIELEVTEADSIVSSTSDYRRDITQSHYDADGNLIGDAGSFEENW